MIIKSMIRVSSTIFVLIMEYSFLVYQKLEESNYSIICNLMLILRCIRDDKNRIKPIIIRILLLLRRWRLDIVDILRRGRSCWIRLQ